MEFPVRSELRLIIINQIKPDAPLSYSGVNEERFPAPISSAERQELCAHCLKTAAPLI